jgi:hypothetical protein
MTSAWAGLLAGVLLVGCAAARQMTASVDDYELYRQTCTARTVEQRLRASLRYLNDMPRGRWREQVGTWFEAADLAYYERTRNSATRLRAYLRLLPDGPRASAARSRLAELELEAEHRRRRERKFELQVRAYERQLARAERQRQKFVGHFVTFVRHVASITTWGEPTWELDPRLIVDWRIRPPPGSCRASRCVKTLSLRYAVPDEGKISPRQAVFDVVFELRQGGVMRATLTGPELFSRVAEAAELRPTRPGDVMARAGAIASVLDLLAPVLEESFPTASCARPAISPVVLLRECDSRRLCVVAAETPEEDRIEVEPLLRQ